MPDRRRPSSFRSSRPDGPFRRDAGDRSGDDRGGSRFDDRSGSDRPRRDDGPGGFDRPRGDDRSRGARPERPQWGGTRRDDAPRGTGGPRYGADRGGPDGGRGRDDRFDGGARPGGPRSGGPRPDGPRSGGSRFGGDRRGPGEGRGFGDRFGGPRTGPVRQGLRRTNRPDAPRDDDRGRPAGSGWGGGRPGDGGRFGRPRDGERPGGDRPYGERRTGPGRSDAGGGYGRPNSGRPGYGRPDPSRPDGERRSGGGPRGFGGRPRDEGGFRGDPRGEQGGPRSYGDRPSGDRPFERRDTRFGGHDADRPGSDRPGPSGGGRFGARYGAGREGGRGDGERPGNDRFERGRPEGRPDGRFVGRERPGPERPGTERPQGERGRGLAGRTVRGGTASPKSAAPTPRVLTEPVRINRYLAQAGIAARRKADDIVAAGHVSINGEVVTELGTVVQPGDRVEVRGRLISPSGHVTILLNKPDDTITTKSDERDRTTVLDLVAIPEEEKAALFPVGRLDRDTLGVLLLTTDGDLAHRLTHPSFEVEKMYLVETAESVKPHELALLRQGVALDDGEAKADMATYTSDHHREIGLSIHEGRNRIVRRMIEAIGHEVVRLERVRYAGLTTEGVRRGKWRRLSDAEVRRLRRLVGLK